ncbi:MAG: helix-turn-helix domain-containing protein [Ginsengibacter sp.]
MKVRNQEYLNAFGENLKRLIENKKKTPEHVAALGNIETKQVYRAINGEHSISLSMIAAIAKGLGVPPKKLLDFEFDFGDD